VTRAAEGAVLRLQLSASGQLKGIHSAHDLEVAGKGQGHNHGHRDMDRLARIWAPAGWDRAQTGHRDWHWQRDGIVPGTPRLCH
jgi:hypothetical protein